MRLRLASDTALRLARRSRVHLPPRLHSTLPPAYHRTCLVAPLRDLEGKSVRSLLHRRRRQGGEWEGLTLTQPYVSASANKHPRPEAVVLGRPPRGRFREVAPVGGVDVHRSDPSPSSGESDSRRRGGRVTSRRLLSGVGIGRRRHHAWCHRRIMLICRHWLDLKVRAD